MGFREIVRQVQRDSGLSSQESKEALELMVESIAVRLDESKRKDFASQLPEVLSDIALSVMPSDENSHGDLIRQFMLYENLGEKRAKRHIKAAWKALKEAMPVGYMVTIKKELASSNAILLS